MPRFTPPFTKARDVLLHKAHAYCKKGRYFQVQVFSIWFTEVELLVHAYEGSYYKHQSGYLWILSNRDKIAQMVEKVQDGFPSTYKFEDKLKPLLEATKKDTP